MQERIKHWWSNTFLPALKAMPKNLQIFLSTPMVLKNLGLMLITLLSFCFIVILGLNIYTQHGESIYLDNLQRLPIKKVEKMARKGDFKVVVFDSIWKPDIKPGVVLEQNPIPGSKIKEGRTVYLTISSSTPPKVDSSFLSYPQTSTAIVFGMKKHFPLVTSNLGIGGGTKFYI